MSRRSLALSARALHATVCWRQPPLLAQTSSESAGRIGSYLEAFAAKGELSGTVLIARADTILYEGSFGRSWYPDGPLNAPSTLFNIASVTKPLTQIITAQLVEKRGLTTGDTLTKWIPTFPNGDRITVEQLLTHESGIPHRVTTKADVMQSQTAASMTALAAQQALLFDPGSATRYSSAAYSVLARVLELAGHDSYAGLLRTMVFEPAGIRDAVDATEPERLKDPARSYLRTAEGPMAADESGYSYLVGAGSIYATPRDLFAIVRALLAGKYGNRARFELVGQEAQFLWNGSTAGYRALVGYDSRERITIIVVANLLTGAIDRIVRDLPTIARGESVTPKVPDVQAVALSPEEQAKDVGMYARKGGPADSLYFLRPTLARRGDFLLLPISTDAFFSPADYQEVGIVRTSDGAIQALRWGPSGGLLFDRVNPPVEH